MRSCVATDFKILHALKKLNKLTILHFNPHIFFIILLQLYTSHLCCLDRPASRPWLGCCAKPNFVIACIASPPSCSAYNMPQLRCHTRPSSVVVHSSGLTMQCTTSFFPFTQQCITLFGHVTVCPPITADATE